MPAPHSDSHGLERSGVFFDLYFKEPKTSKKGQNKRETTLFPKDDGKPRMISPTPSSVSKYQT
jgi:hypothetical protein